MELEHQELLVVVVDLAFMVVVVDHGLELEAEVAGSEQAHAPPAATRA